MRLLVIYFLIYIMINPIQSFRHLRFFFGLVTEVYQPKAIKGVLVSQQSCSCWCDVAESRRSEHRGRSAGNGPRTGQLVFGVVTIQAQIGELCLRWDLCGP